MGNLIQKKRIDWIDYAKGFGIILVIIGHTVLNNSFGSFTRGAIYSFHMPLFFILSCVTSKYSVDLNDWLNRVKKSFKHLMIPALLVVVINIVGSVIKDHSLILNFEYWHNYLYEVLFASGVTVHSMGKEIFPIGIPWFFFALFFGRSIFDYLHLKTNENQLFVICAISSILGIVLGQTSWLIFSLDICLAIMPLFYFGYKLKNFKVEEKPFKKFILYGVVWLSTLIVQFPDFSYWTYMELACRRYTLYPLCFITAIAGTMMIAEFSYMFSKLGKFTAPIKFLGKESMYLLLVHCVDGYWWKLWNVENHQFATAGLRFVVDLGIFLIVIAVVYLSKFVKLKIKANKSTEIKNE